MLQTSKQGFEGADVMNQNLNLDLSNIRTFILSCSLFLQTVISKKKKNSDYTSNEAWCKDDMGRQCMTPLLDHSSEHQTYYSSKVIYVLLESHLTLNGFGYCLCLPPDAAKGNGRTAAGKTY